MIRWTVLALAWWGPVLAQDWGLTQSQTLTAGGAKQDFTQNFLLSSSRASLVTS
jgi:hypothetical protein